jgi:hypothetical protein
MPVKLPFTEPEGGGGVHPRSWNTTGLATVATAPYVAVPVPENAPFWGGWQSVAAVVEKAPLLGGHVITGGCVSLTVTVNMQLAVLADASVAEQVTVVVPFGKVAPDAGTQVTALTPGQLSVAVGAA